MTVKLGIEDRVTPFLRQGGEALSRQNTETIQSLPFRAVSGQRHDTASDLAIPAAADGSQLAPARGLLVGLLAGIVLWVGICVLAWMWFR